MANPQAYACCDTARLRIVHQFGAQVHCLECGLHGPWVPGTNYQAEERAAIRAWNAMIELPAEQRQKHERGWVERTTAGVAPAPQCPKGCGPMGTFFDGWRCNRCGETARGVPASEYLAKIKADPRRAAALQRARDRTAGVATRHPRCGYPYCACVGECFAASQPGVTAGVMVGAPSVPPSEKP